jgi:hypothetical protein
MISAVGIVVPARDEQRRIRDCVRGLLTAVRALPPDVDVAVCVVADRCLDRTARLARAASGRHPGSQVVVNRTELTIGEVRDLGVRHVLAALPHAPSRTLLLSTDADSVVAPDWALGHVRVAASGVHAAAGVVELDGRHALPPLVATRYADVLAGTRGVHGHGNVYAANLGVRADAYLAVGGFGVTATGEDHALWRRLGDAGYRRRYVEEPRVRTSARTHGRAHGGLADLLRALHDTQTIGYTHNDDHDNDSHGNGDHAAADEGQERTPWPSAR